jgi:hypothetical protein
MDPTVHEHLRTGRFKYLNTTLEELRGVEVFGSMCSRTSKRVTTSYCGAGWVEGELGFG